MLGYVIVSIHDMIIYIVIILVSHPINIGGPQHILISIVHRLLLAQHTP